MRKLTNFAELFSCYLLCCWSPQ